MPMQCPAGRVQMKVPVFCSIVLTQVDGACSCWRMVWLTDGMYGSSTTDRRHATFTDTPVTVPARCLWHKHTLTSRKCTRAHAITQTHANITQTDAIIMQMDATITQIHNYITQTHTPSRKRMLTLRKTQAYITQTHKSTRYHANGC